LHARHVDPASQQQLKFHPDQKVLNKSACFFHSAKSGSMIALECSMPLILKFAMKSAGHHWKDARPGIVGRMDPEVQYSYILLQSSESILG
jgi:hypothetical protein